MAVTNTRIVRRSNALLDWAYGRRFRYAETDEPRLVDRRRRVASAMATGGSAAADRAWAAATSTRCRRGSSSESLPKPGTGPSERVRERGHYKVETYTTTTTGARYGATMSQKGDPGYKATSVLLGESGSGAGAGP